MRDDVAESVGDSLEQFLDQLGHRGDMRDDVAESVGDSLQQFFMYL